MTLKEFNCLVKETSARFCNLPSFKNLRFMELDEIKMRIVGALFYANINQNINIPPEEEYDLNDFDDIDEFYYDFQNHIDGTMELYLTDAFINLSILCHEQNLFPFEKKLTDLSLTQLFEDDKEPLVEWYYDNYSNQYNDYSSIILKMIMDLKDNEFDKIMWNILCLLDDENINLIQILDYKFKYETY